MEDARIILSASWIALMLTYLLGDVLRIYAGDFKPGKIGGRPATQNLLLGSALLMTVPIAMVFLSLTLSYPVNRWANIIAAIVFLGFNHRTAKVFLSLRQIPHNCRSRIQRPDYLVRVAMARLARKISFTLEE